jgi:hypothetical protein
MHFVVAPFHRVEVKAATADGLKNWEPLARRLLAGDEAQDYEMGRKLDGAFRRARSERVRLLRRGGAPSHADWIRETPAVRP